MFANSTLANIFATVLSQTVRIKFVNPCKPHCVEIIVIVFINKSHSFQYFGNRTRVTIIEGQCPATAFSSAKSLLLSIRRCTVYIVQVFLSLHHAPHSLSELSFR